MVRCEVIFGGALKGLGGAFLGEKGTLRLIEGRWDFTWNGIEERSELR